MQEVVLGYDVREIEPFTFQGYESLKNVKIGEGITCLPEGCFEYAGLESVEIPGNVETIGSRAFYYCKDLREVTLKKGVKRIQAFCFVDTNLWHITIPDTVEVINKSAFDWYRPGPDVEIAEGIKIELSNYFALFQEGRLDKGKLTSLIEEKKTEGNFSKEIIKSIAKPKDVAMEDEKSGEIMEEIERNKEKQNPNLEKR